MKCPNCGCKDFYKDILKTGIYCTEGGSDQPIKVNGGSVIAYVCKNCARIEFYSEEALEKWVSLEKDKEQKEKDRIAFENEKNILLKEKKELELIVDDENQTVKNVKLAQTRLIELEKRLMELEESYRVKCRKHPFSLRG